jgi:acetyl esterase
MSVSVHPQIQAVIDRMAELKIPAIQTLTPVQARAQVEATVAARPQEPAPIDSFEARTMPGPAGDVSVNVYRPLAKDLAGDTDRPALLVYFHGGGHVFGNPGTHDCATRNLCAGAGCVVVSVDYRKGPEDRFPAAVDDAYGITKWCSDNADELGIDATRIAVGGDSAGGNLACVVAMLARDSDGPSIAFQLLVYPVADYTCASGSYERYAKGYGLLEADTMLWFQGHYLSDASQAQDWRASPLKAQSHANLPPALFQLAEYDVLHDEGLALAEAMKAAGTEVTLTDYAGMIHGFFTLTPIVDGATEAQAEASAALRTAFEA